MTPEQTEIYRKNILRQLDACRVPLLGAALLNGLKWGGFESTDAAEMELEIAYLVEKGFVRVVPDQISAGVRRYKITAAGIEFMEANL